MRQIGLKVWSSGLLINLLLTVCPLVTCVLEKDEAAIESSEFNATSVADVDKRVKRRLHMGNCFLPLSMCCHAACARIPDFTSFLTLFFYFFLFCENHICKPLVPSCVHPQNRNSDST